ncbi:MAG TPA: cyclic nucleotide-gated ion channel [Rhizomicrobium sp.]|nr:cyclic nucleotide-gated ion channel [Rhizomicrobium sp.]
MSQVLPRESIRRRVYVALEGGHAGGTAGTIIEIILIALIIANVVAYTLQSIPSVEREYWRHLIAFEIISVGIFTIEYVLRLWTAPEDPLTPHDGPVRSRFAFALKPIMVIDFFAIAPAYVAVFVPFVDLRVLRLIRMLRLLKIARYSPALSTLAHVVNEERRALFGALLLTLCAMVFAAATMHAVEGHIQPAFATIPSSMWWAITTLTTVGYGDVVPVTALGRFVAGVTMIVGLGLFALPVGIVATGFVNSIHRRDFVVTFGMLARVPLFQGFEPALLAEIMNLLRARLVQPGSVVSARGEPAEAMYFIVSGEVEVELTNRHLRFGAGDFFGELALLRNTMRSATIVATTQCHLLTLSADDFSHLLKQHPAVARKLKNAAIKTIKTFADADDIAQSEVDAAGFWRDVAERDD